MRTLLILCALSCLIGCGSTESNGTSLLTTREVVLPDGFHVAAELAVTPSDMQRGLMYRTELPANRGMLFFHGQAGKYAYWMANCKIPLDIIWMDSSHKVVEISANTPPCPSGGRDCPNYGGHVDASVVLELGGGEAARHGIHEGSVVSF